jgi:ankyrin repeat protein
LSKGADINCKSAESLTPLHFAAKRGDKEMILLLIDSGADLNAQSSSGKIPADFANSKVRLLFDPEGISLHISIS